MQKLRKDKKTVLILLLLLIAAGCSYKAPPRKEYDVTKWKNAPSVQNPVACPEKWWTIFEDPDLSALEEEALQASPTLELAVDKLEEAKAIYIQTRASMFPQFDVSGYANRRHLSWSSLQASTAAATPATTAPPTASSASAAAATPATTTTTTTATSTTAPRANVSLLQLTPEFSYEVDFWGKNASSTRAAGEQVKAAEEGLRTAWLLLTTEVAQRYFELRALDAQLDVLRRSSETYKNQYEINTAKFVAGTDANLDALQAKYEWHRVEAQYESTAIERATALDLLATVVGRPASHLQIAVKPFDPKCVDISCPLPSEVLKKRPDIAQAEHSIESARLMVGVAKTNFLPQVTLSGFFGNQSDRARNLFTWKNHVLSGTASVFQPIFEGGQLCGAYLQAKAQYQESISNWLESVLVAYQEVEDALVTIETLKQQRITRDLELKAAEDAEKLSTMRYERGLIDFLEVIFADYALQTSQTNDINTKHDQILAIVSLIKSIGGSWEPVQK
jgi:multidrug efflux system outer membrane protein